MKDKEFEKYIDHHLENGDFDEDGSSDSAIVNLAKRQGLFSVFKFELKVLCDRVREFFSDFNGTETPIEWFLFLLVLPFILPVAVFTWPILRYKRAVKAFRESYERDLKSGKYVPEKQDEK